MSIKSDKWIRRMAEEHGMIEPFEPNQIKEANGQRIIPTAHPATATTSAVPMNLKSSPISTAPSSTQKISTRKTSLPSKTTAASFRPTPLHWRAQSNISASRATS